MKLAFSAFSLTAVPICGPEFNPRPCPGLDLFQYLLLPHTLDWNVKPLVWSLKCYHRGFKRIHTLELGLKLYVCYLIVVAKVFERYLRPKLRATNKNTWLSKCIFETDILVHVVDIS